MATYYNVHNVARGRGNRISRAGLPTHRGMKQYIGKAQARLVRSRPVLLTEAELLRDLEDLRARAALHLIEVRTTDGRLVDLSTLTPGEVAPSPKLPHPLLDSVANDIQGVGEKMEPQLGDDGSLPHILSPGEKPELLKTKEVEEPLAPP
ncbi:MAG TPA: hypothetical protein VFS41_05750, partial [Edaphobacter sp.]|nr:hypothetical protein [Edaphobacter sp.]